MDITLVNILLTTFGLIGTLAAFGGKTWLEGRTPINKRITGRGYLSLFCLLSAFALGIYKEVNNNKVLDKKNDKILELHEQVSKLQVQLTSYREILGDIRNESRRQVQLVMDQFVRVQGRWQAPNFLYPGSIVKFYTGAGNDLVIRYGNINSGFIEDRLNITQLVDGVPYEIPIIGNSGQSFEWSLRGSWEGKVYVYSSPRQRDRNWSWEEEIVTLDTNRSSLSK